MKQIRVNRSVVPVRQTVGEIQVCGELKPQKYVPVFNGGRPHYETRLAEVVFDGRNNHRFAARSLAENYIDDRPMRGNLVISANQGRTPVRPPFQGVPRG